MPIKDVKMAFMQSKCSLYSSLLLILEERLSLNVLVISLILCLNKMIFKNIMDMSSER